MSRMHVAAVCSANPKAPVSKVAEPGVADLSEAWHRVFVGDEPVERKENMPPSGNFDLFSPPHYSPKGVPAALGSGDHFLSPAGPISFCSMTTWRFSEAGGRAAANAVPGPQKIKWSEHNIDRALSMAHGSRARGEMPDYAAGKSPSGWFLRNVRAALAVTLTTKRRSWRIARAGATSIVNYTGPEVQT
ncbi:hypothetical protein COO60DRAFT_1461779 [Scenedesmus sp. NREL 46B-D3]|nr:hypothetical protein COO60DRAFT_1461779 [Scenedesmus sp. NREL 46B-D3]